ncbi:MAG: translation elongation factor EF-1 subunit alpha [Sulfolobales archaeon]
MPEKPHLNMVIIGHVDHGKSTLVGHMLVLLKQIDEKQQKEVEEQARKAGKETEKFAWLLDKMKEERERGVTIALSFVKFETDKYYFTIIDAPGHRDFVKNMITGTSQADVAVVVVSAKKGEFEAGMSPEGQTREHLTLAKTLGVDQVVVAINKMDLTEPPFSEQRYKEIVDQLKKFMKTLGYKVDEIPFVPVSAWLGDNIVAPSANMKWYKGPTLVDALNTFKIPPKPIDKPLRIPLTEAITVSGVGTVLIGRVETGVLKVGDKVIIMPIKKGGDVRSIEMHHTPMQQALPGDNIGFNVRGIARQDVKRGDVVGHESNPPTVVEEFRARIFLMWHPSAITVGYTPVIHAHTASIACRIVEIEAKLDPKTGQVLEKNPQLLKPGDIAIVKFKPIKPMVIERYQDIPQLGRFAMRDMGKTIGVGQVIDVVAAKI